MTAIEARAQALQKQEPEIWSNLPQDIRRAIKEAVNQGRMICCVTNLRTSDRRRLEQLRYKVLHQVGAYYLITWYHP